MSRRQKHDPYRNTFPFPNEIFLLGLCPGELAVYTYLLCCENRKSHQCWPSYKTIGKAVRLSENTVRKHVCSLVSKGLIRTESTSVMTKDGLKRNGNLLYTTLTIETGIFGGVPLGGLSMGAGVNSDAIYRTADTFDLYDGGVLDMAFLSSAEIDPSGNVNVTKFGGRTAGPGGFINISQNAPKMCFMGTFTAGEQDIAVENGQLNIRRDGGRIKFKRQVEQVSFSGRYALETGQTVLYITERAVFRLTAKGLELMEIAPGIELEKDILSKMEFRPLISPELRPMDSRIFRPEKMGLILKGAEPDAV